MSKTILFLAANPIDKTRLQLEVEVREIENSLRSASFRDDFVLKKKGAVRSKDVIDAFIRYKPWLVHFSGHGSGMTGLVLEDDAGQANVLRSLDVEDDLPIPPTRPSVIAELFKQIRSHTECVVLNACYSDIQAHEITQHIPFVIGMNQAIEDPAAITFSTHFYKSLGERHSLEQAFEWGKTAILTGHDRGENIPVLLKNPDANFIAEHGGKISNILSKSINTTPQQSQLDGHYDIFISYRSTQRDWAESLTRNLTAQGYKIFFDQWELQGGRDFTQTIAQALRNSHCALLVATPEAAESGWVQHEYNLMLNLQAQKSDFFFVPLLWGQFPDFPFLDNIHAIDFGRSEEAQYRKAFQQLLAALKQSAPGDKPYFNGQLELPDTIAESSVGLADTQLSFVDSLFRDYIDVGNPVMVLVQEGYSTQHYSQALEKNAKASLQTDAVFCVYLPAGGARNNERFFRRLGKQCGFADVQNLYDWVDALEERLEEVEVFLLISGFENCAADMQIELSGQLRSLIEKYRGDFKLVVFGGERLAAMKYENGEMSFLNHVDSMVLPSVSREDLRTLYLPRYQDLDLDDAALEELLTFTGGHPRLIEAGLRTMKRSLVDWQGRLSSRDLMSLFTHFQTEQEREALCRYLGHVEVCTYTEWSPDALLRRLFWKNLLVEDIANGKLVWRSEIIRDAGKKVLQC